MKKQNDIKEEREINLDEAINLLEDVSLEVQELTDAYVALNKNKKYECEEDLRHRIDEAIQIIEAVKGDK